MANSNNQKLCDQINSLHAERREALLDAKKAHEELGFNSAAFQLDWQHLENLTREIVHCEAQFDKALSADASAVTPLLRDPDIEVPEDGFHVVVVTDNESDSVVLAYHDAGSWLDVDGDSVMDGSVVGWCWQDEAADVLRKEMRHASL